MRDLVPLVLSVHCGPFDIVPQGDLWCPILPECAVASGGAHGSQCPLEMLPLLRSRWWVSILLCPTFLSGAFVSGNLLRQWHDVILKRL